VGKIAHLGEMKRSYEVLARLSEGKRLLEDLIIDGRVILEWFSADDLGIGLIWLMTEHP